MLDVNNEDEVPRVAFNSHGTHSRIREYLVVDNPQKESDNNESCSHEYNSNEDS